MSDEREIPVFEIPLAGDDTPSAATAPDRPPPNWRKLVAVSGLAGVVLGVVVAVVIWSTDGDEDESAPATTALDDEELSPSITVPPTLTPIEPDGSDGPTSGRGVAPLPTIADADPETLATYDLDAALAALAENAPRRAHTRYVAGADGFVLDVDVTHDSLNERYRVELDDGGRDRQIVLLDPRGDASYVAVGTADDGEGWLRIPNQQIAVQTGAADVGALARSILLGPVRSDTDPSVVAAAGLASLDGTPVREFTVEVAAGAVPEWVAYAFAPSAEVPPPPAGDPLTFTVHVDGDARLRRVAGASAYGATEQSIVHTIENLPRLEVIDLPTRYAILDENGNVVTDSAELVPEYEPVTGAPPAGDFDLVAALAQMVESSPLRATLETVGDGSNVTTAERDPSTGVVAVTPGAFADPTLLIETTTGRAFVRDQRGTYTEDARVDAEAFLTDLLHGVIDPDALADVEPVGFVRRDGETLRRYDGTVPPTALRSVLFVGFGLGLDPQVPLPVRVFVDDASRVVEMHVLSTGGVPSALVQRFEHDVEAPTITVPVDAG